MKIARLIAIVVLHMWCNAAHAQTSVSQRAQALQKLEEDLNAGDPNLRIAALEYAMENGSIAEKERAYRIAIASSDVVMKSLAIRYRICGSKRITLNYPVPPGHGPDGYAKNRGFISLNGLTNLDVKKCDVQSGNLEVAIPLSGNAYEKSWGVANISGTEMKINFAFNLGSKWNANCDTLVSIRDGAVLKGRMSCNWHGEVFGPVDVQATL